MSTTHSLPTSSSTEPKKKFGTNLNKLAKPPPPSTNTTSSTSSNNNNRSVLSHQSSARGGLLVLTTKKSNSLPVGVSSSGVLSSKAKSGALSLAPKPINTPSLRSESFSTYDSLQKPAINPGGLIAGRPVINDPSIAGASPSQPTAWGIVDKAPSSAPLVQNSASTNILPVLAPKGSLSSGYKRSTSDENSKTSSSENKFKTGVNGISKNINGFKESDNFSSTKLQAPLQPGNRSNTLIFDNQSASYPKNISNNVKDREYTPRMESNLTSAYVPGASSDKTRNNNESSKPSNLAFKNSVTTKDHDEIISENKVISKTQTKSPPGVMQNDLNFKSTRPESSPSIKDTTTNNSSVSEVDEQMHLMSRLAKERTERRKAEEQALENERKERAARRLKELDDKKVASAPMVFEANSNPEERKSGWKSNKPLKNPNLDVSESSEVVLEVLGRPKQETVKPRSASYSEQSNGSNGNGNKALVNPAKTFSSLVGGSKLMTKPEGVMREHHHPQTQHMNHSAAPANSYANREGLDEPPISYIQLSSYDDRDRGERSTTAGPRMLFDPKSGSMVAAPSADKRGYHYGDDTQGGKGRKDRNKPKIRNGRDREKDTAQQFHLAKRQENSFSVQDDYNRKNRRGADDYFAEDLDGKGGRRPRRKDDVNSNRRERKVYEKDDVLANAGTTTDDFDMLDLPLDATKRNTTRTSTQKQGNSGKVSFPRTCGVLYKFDDNGALISFDGCEPDQGYGAHSVPGGRIRNSVAYSRFLEAQNRGQKTAESTYRNLFQSQHGNNVLEQTPHNAALNGTSHSVNYGSLNMGPKQSKNKGKYLYNPKSNLRNEMQNASDRLMNDFPNQTITTTKSSQFEHNFTLPASLRVKPSETISILTGDPESPELQATANPWAPSQAALAAAAANSKTHTPEPKKEQSDFDLVSSNIMNVLSDDNSNHDEDNSQPFEGLGFDPTENMDTVIMSPSTRSEAADDDIIDLKALALNAPTGDALNLFAPLSSPSRYLDSSTWATGGSLARSPGRPNIAAVPMGSLNWNLLSAERRETQSPLHTQNSNSLTNPSTPASFLSLSLNNGDGVNWAGSLGGAWTSKGSGEASES